MTADDNRALLDLYLNEVWVAHNPQAADRFLAHDYRRHISPFSGPLDRKGQIERLKSFLVGFPDITIEVEDVISEEDRLAFRSLMRGTHRGTFLGVEPTGRSVSVSLIDVIHLRDGQFVEHWGGPDLFDLSRQLDAGGTAG